MYDNVLKTVYTRTWTFSAIRYFICSEAVHDVSTALFCHTVAPEKMSFSANMKVNTKPIPTIKLPKTQAPNQLLIDQSIQTFYRF